MPTTNPTTPHQTCLENVGKEHRSYLSNLTEFHVNKYGTRDESGIIIQESEYSRNHPNAIAQPGSQYGRGTNEDKSGHSDSKPNIIRENGKIIYNNIKDNNNRISKQISLNDNAGNCLDIEGNPFHEGSGRKNLIEKSLYNSDEEYNLAYVNSSKDVGTFKIS